MMKTRGVMTSTLLLTIYGQSLYISPSYCTLPVQEQHEEQDLMKDSFMVDHVTGPLPALHTSLPEEDACKKLDLMFLMDTTESMDTEITLVQGKAETIAEAVSNYVSDVRMAVASVQDAPAAYGVETDSPYTFVSDFTYDPQQTIAALYSIKMGNGGDEPEAYPYALRMASNEHWRSDAKRILILFADSYARDDRELEESVKTANFHLYSVLSIDYTHWEEYKTYWERYSQGVYQMEASTDIIPLILNTIKNECPNNRVIS